jgi:hypothetical protein
LGARTVFRPPKCDSTELTVLAHLVLIEAATEEQNRGVAAFRMDVEAFRGGADGILNDHATPDAA